jgi:hypothetical protein
VPTDGDDALSPQPGQTQVINSPPGQNPPGTQPEMNAQPNDNPPDQ